MTILLDGKPLPQLEVETCAICGHVGADVVDGECLKHFLEASGVGRCESVRYRGGK